MVRRHVATVTGLVFIALLSTTVATADEHGLRLGKVLAGRVNDSSATESILAKCEAKKADADFTDEEMNAVLDLLGQYMHVGTLQRYIKEKPAAFRHFRLVRVQAYLSLLGVFLSEDQIDVVLVADLMNLRNDDFTTFLTSKALTDEAYDTEALPKKLTKSKVQGEILEALAKEIREGSKYPLPEGRAREVVVATVGKVEKLLADYEAAHSVETTPAASAGPAAMQQLLVEYRRLTTTPERRKAIAAELVRDLPRLLQERLGQEFAGQLGYDDQSDLLRCVELLLATAGPN